MCNTTDAMRPFLQWNVTIPHIGGGSGFLSTVSQQSDLPICISNIFFNITRDSNNGTLPLVSTLSVANVTASLNGTKVDCIQNVERSSSVVLMKTINIIGTEQGGDFECFQVSVTS